MHWINRKFYLKLNYSNNIFFKYLTCIWEITTKYRSWPMQLSSRLDEESRHPKRTNRKRNHTQRREKKKMSSKKKTSPSRAKRSDKKLRNKNKLLKVSPLPTKKRYSKFTLWHQIGHRWRRWRVSYSFFIIDLSLAFHQYFCVLVLFTLHTICFCSSPLTVFLFYLVFPPF